MKKEQLNQQFDYVLSCINNDDETLNTPEEKLQYFAECFGFEFNHEHNRHRFPDSQERISEYLKGLPGCCRIDFADYKIIQIGKSWGFCKTTKEESRFCNNWWDMIAFRIIQLSERHNVKF